MNKYSFKSTGKKQAVFIVYLQCLRTSQCLCNILIVYIRESASNVNGLVMECATVSRKKLLAKIRNMRPQLTGSQRRSDTIEE